MEVPAKVALVLQTHCSLIYTSTFWLYNYASSKQGDKCISSTWAELWQAELAKSVVHLLRPQWIWHPCTDAELGLHRDCSVGWAVNNDNKLQWQGVKAQEQLQAVQVGRIYRWFFNFSTFIIFTRIETPTELNWIHQEPAEVLPLSRVYLKLTLTWRGPWA